MDTNGPDEIIDAEIVEAEYLPAVVEQTHGQADSSTGPVVKWSERWWELQAAHTQSRRCVAHRRNGDRCKRFGLQGASVCKHHGGNAPQVRNAAKVRLELASDRMAKQLLGIATDDAVAPETRLKAIVNALDRTIGRAPTTVEIGPAPKAYEAVFEGIYSGPPAESPSVSGGYGPAGVSATHSPASAYGESDYGAQAGAGEAQTDSSATGYDDMNAEYPPRDDSSTYPSERSESSQDQRPRRSRRGEDGRDAHQQRAGRHITGDDAMRLANLANARNREISALPPLRELESPHRRYPRP